jgi:hypothetical protein
VDDARVWDVLRRDLMDLEAYLSSLGEYLREGL